MNLDELMPAWQQYKLQNSLEGLNHQAVLRIIDQADQEVHTHKLFRLAANVTMFLMLLICCQGG